MVTEERDLARSWAVCGIPPCLTLSGIPAKRFERERARERERTREIRSGDERPAPSSLFLEARAKEEMLFDTLAAKDSKILNLDRHRTGTFWTGGGAFEHQRRPGRPACGACRMLRWIRRTGGYCYLTDQLNELKDAT